WPYVGGCHSRGGIQTVGKLPRVIVEASPPTTEHGLAGSEHVIGGSQPWLIEQFSRWEASQWNGRIFRMPQESAERRRIRAPRLVLGLIEDGVAEILAIDPWSEMRKAYAKVDGQLPRGFP